MGKSPDEKDVGAIDVLVAGAGPAGLAAARAAAAAGASVLVADAKSEIGLPVRCAEFVPKLIAREVDIPDAAVAQTVEEMLVLVAEGDGPAELGRVRSPGFIHHPERLVANLAARATGAGAEIGPAPRATPAADGMVVLTRAERRRRVRP